MPTKKFLIQPMECTHVNRIDSLVLSVDDTYEEYKELFVMNLKGEREKNSFVRIKETRTNESSELATIFIQLEQLSYFKQDERKSLVYFSFKDLQVKVVFN